MSDWLNELHGGGKDIRRLHQIRKLRNEPMRSARPFKVPSLRFKVMGPITKRTQPFMYRRFEIPDLRWGNHEWTPIHTKGKIPNEAIGKSELKTTKTPRAQRDELPGQVFLPNEPTSFFVLFVSSWFQTHYWRFSAEEPRRDSMFPKTGLTRLRHGLG
jgi:hypothetical protein